MRIEAGIDVGNSTTEVVVAVVGEGGVEIVGTGRAPTRRAKGSRESLEGAAALVRKLERQHDVLVETAVVAPLRPVATGTALVPEETADTGRLWVVSAGAGTAGGPGVGVGRPVRLGDPMPEREPIVVVVPAGTGYVDAVAGLGPLLTSGRVAAVLVEDDEAVLIANRITAGVPVVDEIDVGPVLAADRVAVEVSEGGRPLRLLSDPLKLVEALGLARDELGDAARLAALLRDSTNGVVAVGAAATSPPAGEQAWIEVRDEGRVSFLEGHPRISAGPVGLASAYALPPDRVHHVDDLWTVDLATVGAAVRARRAGMRVRPVGAAALRSDAPYTSPAAVLSDLLAVPVRLVTSEAAAARAGGLSTPRADDDAVVIDLGGGTIDAISPTSIVVAAGAGELLTVSVAAMTGITAAAAEWVKRGPSHRVEAPQVLLGEDGARSFLDRPAPSDTVGSLVVPGPAGWLPFGRSLAPGEWRALRLQLKVDLVGGNILRALRTLGESPETVVVVGGPAGDDEVLSALSAALPAGTAVGRGDVGAVLGHRFAVAYGLLVLEGGGG